MDLSAFIVVLLMTAGFFGFILWMAFYSRKNNSEKLPAEIDFSEVRKRNEQYLKE